MSNIKGQTVYVVTEFNREDIVQEFVLYADKNEADKAAGKANHRAKQYGGYAYAEETTIR